MVFGPWVSLGHSSGEDQINMMPVLGSRVSPGHSSGEDLINMMPVLGSRVSPGYSRLRLCADAGVTNVQPMITAEPRQALTFIDGGGREVKAPTNNLLLTSNFRNII
ncbi:hypothetical protein PoB_007523100 [Plakobranchus ocellatus]|uniref:Uncharacterized protein n=1 Tax=Plakobranchus ocellatus TaxID=259542 RepID=A0AAV4DX88_9GAST|nr:hypothetical protein PoB_007523100 [Plakobranchus ocellatus]